MIDNKFDKINELNKKEQLAIWEMLNRQFQKEQNYHFQALLAEYNTLRSELVVCGNKLYTIVGIGIVMLTFTLPNYGKPLFWVGLIFGLFFVFLLGILNTVDIRRLSLQVQKLESEINKCTGKHSLTWETSIALYKKGGILNPPRTPQ